MKRLPPLGVRWMLGRDLAELELIEAGSDRADRWTTGDWKQELRQRNAIAKVATEPDGLVVGAILYRLHATRIHLVNLVVHPAYLRRGVGTFLMNDVASKLSPSRRRVMSLCVHERNLEAQRFFRSLGFRAVGVSRKSFGEDDGYSMIYQPKVCSIAA